MGSKNEETIMAQSKIKKKMPHLGNTLGDQQETGYELQQVTSCL